MRRLTLSLLSVLTLLAASASTAADHRVHLTDGSVLQGTVLSLDEEKVLLATAYVDTLALPRGQVAAILLRPELALPFAEHGEAAEAAPAEGEAPATPPAELGSGTLEIALKGDAVRSSVRFRGNHDRERMKRLNTIYLRVYMNKEMVFETSDDSMEKAFRERQWFFLRNRHQFEPVTLEAPAGIYEVQVVIGNKLDELQEEETQSELVSAEIVLKELTIRADEKTRVVLEGKGSRWGYGKYTLELLSSR